MSIGAGHAAASAGLNAQFKPHSLKDFLPKPNVARLVCFFSAVGKEVVRSSIFDALSLWKYTCKPLLRQQNGGGLVAAQRLRISLSMHQCHRGIKPHQRYPVFLKVAQRFTVEMRGFFKGFDEALHLKRFPVGPERGDVDLVAKP